MIRNIQTREGYDIWDRISSIPRNAFLLAPEGNRVVKVPGMGSWIDMYEVYPVVDDAQSQLNILRDALERISEYSECDSSREIAKYSLQEASQ